MTKKEVQKRVLQNGKPLALSKFMWDDGTNTFSAKEDGLVIDFGGIGDCTFRTGSTCTFYTGWGCTFDTGPGCTFGTGYSCTFNTGPVCTFSTLASCTWVAEGKSYSFSPLYIMGSRWGVNVLCPGLLRIGCEVHTFKEWDKMVMPLAEEHDVSQETLTEYLGLIKVAREWAKQKGWLTPK